MSVNYIKPTELNTQILSMNSALKKDNEALEDLSKVVVKLSTESKLQGAAWKVMKELFSNHDSVIKALILANSALLTANESLSHKMGSEELIRSQIQEKISELQRSISSNNNILSELPTNPLSTLDVWSIRNGAQQTISLNLQVIKRLKDKLETMDKIETNTKGLYKEAIELYEDVKNGIGLLTDCWNGKEYVSPGNSDWATKIQIKWKYKKLQEEIDEVIDKISTKDENGKITAYDYAELACLLKKDPEKITEAEYAAIAYVAATTDDPKILETIISGCYTLKGDAKQIADGYGITSIIVESEKTEKLKKILDGIKCYEAGLYITASMISKEELVAIYKDGVFGRIEQNKAVFEELLVGPDVIAVVSRKNITGFQQSLIDQAISITRDKDGNLNITFCNGDVTGSTYSDYVPKVHILTISPMSIGDICADKGDEEDIDWYTDSVGAVTSYVDVIQNLPEDVLSDFMQNGVSELPGMNKIISGVGVIQDLMDTNKQIKAYNYITYSGDIKKMIRYFNLYGVRVTDAAGGNSKLSYKVSVGLGDSKTAESTQKILDNLDKNLSKGGAYEDIGQDMNYNSTQKLTIEDLLYNPEKVIEFQQKLEVSCYKPDGNSVNVEDIYHETKKD